MKYCLLPLLFLSFSALAQTDPHEIVRYKIYTVDQVPAPAGQDVYRISAPYGKPVLSPQMLADIKKRQILSVELVYTRFRRSDKFDQTKLNLNRLQNLKKILPAAFSDNKVDWQVTEQTGAKDYATGQTYFHGFIIHTRKIDVSAKEREAEVKALEAELEAVKTSSSAGTATGSSTAGAALRERNTSSTYDTEPIKYYDVGPKWGSDPCELIADVAANLKYPMEAKVRKISGRVQAQITVNRNGDIQDIKITEGIGFGCDDAVKQYLKTMPKWTPARSKAGNVNAYVTMNFWFAMDEAHTPPEEMPCEQIIITPDGKTVEISGESPTRTVSEIFDRQSGWKQVAVVCDVTASMGPYMGDLLKWFRINNSRIKHFTFFNDGDMTPDHRKPIGSTGGIYQMPATRVEDVEAEMYKAMRNGFGGDVAENDVEALLAAEKNAPFADRIVWIADNYATPRDLALLAQITKPVSIVLCSTKGGVNSDFLNIARQIRATLHTLNTDLPDLSQMKDGERVTIDEKVFELANGKFKRVY